MVWSDTLAWPMWLIATGTSSAGLLAGCCVDLLVHAVRYTKLNVYGSDRHLRFPTLFAKKREKDGARRSFC